jgi:flavin-dependent dehydrogenase
MYDVIIVGARCAGSPLAMLLARKGHRVLVVDRSTFPSDIMSTHYIQAAGVMRLSEWGLYDQVVAAGTPPIDKMTMHLEDLSMVPPKEPGMQDPICPRRTILDKILVDAAVAAGAEMREAVTLQELTFDGDRVTGIRAKSKDGATFDEPARIVIGADGIRSSVARMVDAPSYDEHPALTCGYYTYWSGVETDGADLSLNNKTGLLSFPTNDGLVCLGMMRPLADFKEFRGDIDAHYRRYATENLPAIGEQLATAKREEKYTGTAETQNYFRRPYGPGWALVGDAGYHRDPVTGLGISDAFRDAELLAEAIDAGFAGRKPIDEALAGYEAKRNEAARPDYERTIFTAMLPSKAEMLAAMQANAPAAAAAAADAQAAQAGSAQP